MKIKVWTEQGTQIFDSEATPIMVLFEGKEKECVQTMSPEATKLSSWNKDKSGVSPEQMEAWMEEPL